ncbi:MAG TPA: FemAB family XrtA/PEP-CTERM system-associated protein [Gemmataceae bacterium]|nr:FemAB family XrtA/PEP-CTERM system-associated protein [Gemmataceae bacterium]
MPLSREPAWLSVCARGLGHTPYLLTAEEGGDVRGHLPLASLNTFLFGRFLVSMPYLNYGGVSADDPAAATLLIDRAIALADELGVRFLELRHTTPVAHPKLTERPGAKVHMRLALPPTPEPLWKSLKDKVRNLVRKGQKQELAVAWGAHDLLPDFYAVFSENMRDLGTPAYGRALFAAILDEFPGRAELCVVRADKEPVAGALLLHGRGVTEVPSASALRRYNHTSANMLMYWHLLERAVLRGQTCFDFGRSSPDSPTFRFKKQWGAEPEPATWQYYVRKGSTSEMRPDNPKYRRMIRAWQRLPLWVSRLLGPAVVRGIP